jgi:hypothetical protein
MNVKRWKADQRKKERYICARIPDEGTNVCPWDGNSEYPPTIAELIPLRDDDGALHELLIETNDPDVVDLDAVYKYFRRQEMTYEELWRELQWVDPAQEFRRKVSALAPRERKLFDAASETMPIQGEALAAKVGFDLDGQTRGHLAVLGKRLGLLQKARGGFIRTRPPKGPYA